MRMLAAAATSALVFAALQPITPADAEKARAKALPTRYCAQYFGGAQNCGFYSMQQCLQSLSGNGGSCFIAAQQDLRPKGKLPPVQPLSPRDEDDDED